MPQETAADEPYPINNLVNGQHITIHQGENAVNMIFINRPDKDNPDFSEHEIKEENEKNKAFKEGVEEETVENTEPFTQDQIKTAMDEITNMQLCDMSQLRTLIYILEKNTKFGEEVGFLETRQKIDVHVQALPSIDGAFLLAAEYMKRNKEFEAIAVCKHVVLWLKYNAQMGGDGKMCIKRMVEECMSMARDAAMQIFQKSSPDGEIYRKYLVPLMYEMLIDVQEVQCVDRGFKAGLEAMAAYYVSCIHFSLEQWDEMYAVCYNAIIKMQQAYGSHAKKHLAYGDVLLMAAMAQYRLDKLQEAESLWQQTIEAFEAEGNNNNNNEKETNIKLATQWLKIVRERLLGIPKHIVQEITK